MINLLTVLAALVPLSAMAGMCEPLKKLQEKIVDCDDNEKLSEASDICLAAFKAQIAAEQAILSSKFDLDIDQAGKLKQKDSIDKGSDTYNASMDKLSALIQEGKAARSDLEGYKKNLLWPFRWTAGMGKRPKDDDPELLELMDQYYCWGEHHDILKGNISELDKMIRELEAAKAEASGMKSSLNQEAADVHSAAGAGGKVSTVKKKERSQEKAPPKGPQSKITKREPPGAPQAPPKKK